MKRKVTRTGPSTLTVSLPSKWAKKYGIKAGEEIELFENNSELIISTKYNKVPIKKMELDITGFSKLLLTKYLHEAYLRGMDEIKIDFGKQKITNLKYSKEEDVSETIAAISKRFIGLEITSQKTNTITLQDMIEKENIEKREIVGLRIYYLIKEFCEEFLKSMDGNFEQFHKKSYEYHDNITKFIYYYFRLLQQAEINDYQKMRLFSLFKLIDFMTDKLRHTSEKVNEVRTITKNMRIYIADIFRLFLNLFNLILESKSDYDKIEVISEQRYALVNKIKLAEFSMQEYKVISECKILIDTLGEFVEAYVSLHFPDAS